MTDEQPKTPPPQQPPPYPYGHYPPQPPYNVYAILSLALGILVFPPLGIYFGNKAKQQIAATGERGIELANAGVVVGWVLTGLLAAFVLLWCFMAVTMFGMFGLFSATTVSVAS
ncbi:MULTISPECIES: DUF4190 domain-containing protein [Catellatospora]|uniref:DUF4190 domain-containing protein n=2 Tax=Catellatospora TaxID=53365 RepID=A0A8J3P3J7_9ACTN|nr:MULTISPECIES: DUF4190 domain-containing protein [Catellatospora]RKE11614.1 uncharacterized protein DUF4190 [Catellatospora citrea]GIF94434.1 hypothetical protein Cch02nite_78780 [Catellatospora chokoriensis]GIG02419.1 hypothetical protein Cci01nite_75120 [Catellatospora citrea]